ncbi:hypothetical protein M8J77_023505 [Diaphorina citri]|nr:hypothetical protein M8J77_023505 [Diaphorina citri]
MKRVKSSLGKRSSSIGGFNSRNSDINASNRTSTNKKKSLILQPGFSRNSRSNSVDTLNDVGHERSRHDSKMTNSIYSSAKKPMQRSKSQANLMTPSTPGNNMSYLPPSMALGSARSKMSTDNRESRMSSMGARISKKDTRPINDKMFILEMTEKVQKLAILHPEAKALMSHGKIRPMTTQLFIILSEIILQYFDHQVVLNNANYATEIPNIAKTFLYRGKLDRTMLITVSTPHTYPNVIAFLSWFVECQEMAKALNFELLFNRFNEEGFSCSEGDEGDDLDFAILIPHVAKCYNYMSKNKSCDQLNAEVSMELKQRSNEQFGEDKLKEGEKELEELVGSIRQLGTQIEAKERELEMMENAVAMLTKDVQEQDVYLVQTQEYIENVRSQNDRVAQELNKTDGKIDEHSKDIQYLNTVVRTQELSLEDKEKLAHERSEIMREINLLEAQINTFNDILYMEQMELSKQRNKVDSSILQYNRELYENLNTLPNAQDYTIGTNILDPQVIEQHAKVEPLVAELSARPEELEEKLASVQAKVVVQDGVLKAMNDSMVALSEKNVLMTNRMKDLKAAFEMEIQRLEADLKSVEREMEIVTMKKPNVLEVEKQLSLKRQELEALGQFKRKNVELWKQKILHLDNEYRRMVQAAETSAKRITAKQKILTDLMNRS